MVRKPKGLLMTITLLLAVSLFLSGGQAFPLEPTVAVLGDAVGAGKAEMKVLDRWVPITGKSFPVSDGANLRTGDGRLSLVFRDSVRMEVGNKSDCVFTGSRGNYGVQLSSGSLGFMVPRGVSLSVTTQTATVQIHSVDGMIKNVSLDAEEHTRGVVIYDGKGTKVMSVSGSLIVKVAGGAQTEVVGAGKALYVEDTGSKRQITPVQLVETVPGGTGGVTPLMGAVGAGAGMAGGFLGVDSLYNSGGGRTPASPSRP